MSNTIAALDGLFARWQDFFEAQTLPTVPYDSSWRSVCEVADSQQDGQIGWQPIKRLEPGTFSNVEFALDIEIHPAINDLYSCYFSADVDAQHDIGPVTLLGVWNDEDFAALQQNIISHIMMKRQLKQPVTIFIGLTAQEDLIISVINDSGAVYLEYVGQEPHVKLADSVALFIDSLRF